MPKKNNPIVRIIPRRGAKRCPYCGNWTKFRALISFKNKRYSKYEEDAVSQVVDYKNEHRIRMITKNVHCIALYWLKDLRGRPDLNNHTEATADILEKATLIEDDNQIKSWDGSRIMGVDRDYPRVEVILRINE